MLLDDLAESVLLSMLQGGWQNTTEALCASAYELAETMIAERERRAPKPAPVEPAPQYKVPFWVDDLRHNGAEWVAEKKVSEPGGKRTGLGRTDEAAVLNLAAILREEGIPFYSGG